MRKFGKEKSLFAIEGIPTISCPHCGESWFAAQTMHEIEQIKRLRKSAVIEREEPVEHDRKAGEMRAEYRREDLGTGVRGKHFADFQEVK